MLLCIMWWSVWYWYGIVDIIIETLLLIHYWYWLLICLGNIDDWHCGIVLMEVLTVCDVEVAWCLLMSDDIIIVYCCYYWVGWVFLVMLWHCIVQTFNWWVVMKMSDGNCDEVMEVCYLPYEQCDVVIDVMLVDVNCSVTPVLCYCCGIVVIHCCWVTIYCIDVLLLWYHLCYVMLCDHCSDGIVILLMW